MCIIINKPEGVKLPSEETLRNCYDRNRDGFGVMYSKAGQVHIRKDFPKLFNLQNWLEKNIKESDACAIHFRLATSGKEDFGNCHPFPLTKNKARLRQVKARVPIAMMHNGVISDYSGHKKFSDTQKFIMDILAPRHVRENLWHREIQKLVYSYVSPDRLLFMRGNGDTLMLGDWTEDNGLFYSNDGYKDSYRYCGFQSSKGTEYCEVCYKEKPRNKMILIDEPSNFNGHWETYICRKCDRKTGYKHSSAQNIKADDISYFDDQFGG